MAVGLAIAATLSPASSLYSAPPTQLSFELAPTSQSTTTSLSDRSLFAANVHPEVDQETLIYVLRSQKVLNPAIAELRRQNIDLTYAHLAENLTIRPAKSGRLEVQYAHSDPEIAQQVVTQLAQTYTAFGQECHVSACEALPYLENEIKALSASLQTNQQALSSLDRPSGYQSLDDQAQWIANRSLELERNISQVQDEIVLTRQRYEEERSHLQRAIVFDPQGFLLEDSIYTDLLQQLQTVEYQLAVQQMGPEADPEQLQGLLRRHQDLVGALSQALAGAVQRFATTHAQASPSIDLKAMDQVEQSILLVHHLNLLEQRQHALSPVYDLLQRQKADLLAQMRDRDTLHQQIYADQHLLTQYKHQKQQLQDEVEQSQMMWRVIAPPERILG